MDTYGFDRKAKVPDIPGSKAKLCITCQAWFAAFGKQRRCDRCVPNAERQRRAQQRHYAQPEAVAVKTRSRRSETPLGVTLCRELAFELAAVIDSGQKARPKADIGLSKPMTRAEAYRYTRRNVALGLQGRSDLERYAA